MLVSVPPDLSERDAGSSNERGAPFSRLALIGNALPRKCGLATFTSHVADALRARWPRLVLDHYAIDDGTGVTYPDDIHTIPIDDEAAYREAAAEIEASGAGAIWLQHEYGIFGGEAGAHILELINSTSLPLVVTLAHRARAALAGRAGGVRKTTGAGRPPYRHGGAGGGHPAPRPWRAAAPRLGDPARRARPADARSRREQGALRLGGSARC